MPNFRLRSSKKQGLAVSAPSFTKVETKSDGGFSRIAQRVDMVVVDLLMDYELDGVQLKAGQAKIILRGDAGLTGWAKKPYTIGGKEFVLCPEGDVIAFMTEAG